jgi:LPS export ABC transporter protein LptC
MNLKQLIKNSGILMGLSTALVLAVMASGCGDEGSNREIVETPGIGVLEPDQITTKAHIFLYSGGHKTTDLLADTIWQFTKLDSAVAYNLFIEFYDTTGARISTLTSQHGYIRQEDNYLAVSGSVVVIGEDSVRLETEYLEWDGVKDSVVTDSFVTVIEGSDILMSYGFQSDPQLKNITFKNKVSGRLTDMEKAKDENK